MPEPAAWFDGVLATGLVATTTDPADLDRGGWWAVLVTFEGAFRAWRFADVRPAALPPGAWPGIGGGPTGEAATAAEAGTASGWTTSLDRAAYTAGVEEIRRRIRAGDVYQVNLCRILSTPVGPGVDPWGLGGVLQVGNPAPYAGVLDVPGARVVTASPELFLARDGDRVSTGPIKGTAPTADRLLPKDRAENVMIVDLMRNDLSRVCRPGTVGVPSLLAVEQHPGLVHLVSTVEGRLEPGVGWRELLAATTPPGSVSGAPKSSALTAIADLEPVARGPYCGAIGWVDGARARLAVGIRTFWWQDGRLCFGTGAGITADSDPSGEWDETELKAARLVGLATRAGRQSEERV